MFAKEFPSTNDSRPQLHPFNVSSTESQCALSGVAVYMKFVFDCIYLILVFPLSAIVLSLGFKEWKHSTSKVMSHSDFFTYNMAAVELFGVFGAAVSIYSTIMNLPAINYVGTYISSFPWNAQMFIPILICFERYLAVVRPLTYMKLRQATGTRIRNIIITIIWLQGVGLASGIAIYKQHSEFAILPVSLMAICLIVVSFCSISVLCVLIRHPPGKNVKDGRHMDKARRRAFRIILIIMGVLTFRFGGNMISYTMMPFPIKGVLCIAPVAGSYTNLPSSMVLPLLYLHRKMKAK